MAENGTKTKALAPIQEVRQTLEGPAMMAEIKKALPPHVDVAKFVRVAMTAVQNNPGLLDCHRQSLYGACIKAATDGLIPDGREAALVQFKGAVQYMPMVAGILKKVRNSGELASIDSQVVYKNDGFTYRPGIDSVPVHSPDWFGERGEAIGVYAVAKTKDGETYIEIMNKDQVLAIKNTSRAKDGGPWAGPFETEMWRKSVIRRLSKRLPMSTDLEQVIQRDDELYDLDKKPEAPAPAAPANGAAAAPAKKSRLDSVIDATPAPAAVPEPGDAQEPEAVDGVPI